MSELRLRTGFTVAGVGMAVLSLVGASAPSAAAATRAPDRNSDVAFSVLDRGAKMPRGRQFALTDIQRHGVSRAQVEALGAGRSIRPVTTNDVASVRAAANPYGIAAEWREKDGWRTVIRNGRWDGANAGFGLAKVMGKHNLTIAAVRATTRYPRPGRSGKVREAGQKYHYRTEVHHIKCRGWWIFKRCRIVETKTVRVGVDFRKLRGGKPFGVVTAFCEKTPGRCPDWVKNAINI